jgi:hypothetical protein
LSSSAVAVYGKLPTYSLFFCSSILFPRFAIRQPMGPRSFIDPFDVPRDSAYDPLKRVSNCD